MDPKLTISDIEYAYNLAEHKTDEELAAILNKPVALVQMLFSLMAGLPKRPWEKVVLPEVAPPPAAAEVPVLKKKKASALKPLNVGRKKKKAPVKKKAAGKKEKTVKQKVEKKPHSAHAQAQERLKQRQVKDRNSIYETRPIDLTGKVAYKLNHKTVVYEYPGADIEKLRKKYHIA